MFQTASSPSLVTIRREYIITGNAKLNQLDLINPICISPFATVDNDKCKSSSNLCFVNAKYKVKMKYEVLFMYALRLHNGTRQEKIKIVKTGSIGPAENLSVSVT